MNNSLIASILITGFLGSYFIWERTSEIEVPNKKIVYEQVDKRKLSNFLNLVKEVSYKHQGYEKVEDSFNTILSASKRLTTKTEVFSHTQNVAAPFPWVMMLSLWVGVGGAFLIINRRNQKMISKINQKEDFHQNANTYLSAEKSLGDFNQIVMASSRAIEIQAQTLDRYIDIELASDLSDCFIERKRLEKLVGNFINASFQLIKSDSEAKGILIQTAEESGKYRLICFLDNFDQEHLVNNKLPELLKHFSVLEKQFSGCRPSIDFHYIEVKNHEGLEIELTFENNSELEAGIARSVQV
jgi:hypothetical protein